MPGQNKGSEKILNTVGQRLGCSPAGIRRLCDSTMVTLPSSEGKGGHYNLGLRLLESGESGSPVLNPDKLVTLLEEYRKCCPQVFAWLLSGGFNPTQLPNGMRSIEIIHACRTAGRLRASGLQLKHH